MHRRRQDHRRRSAGGLWLTELSPLTPDLESVFLDITGTMPEPGTHHQVDDSIEVKA